MSILQGTPINTQGIHPFVALMAQGQAGIDRGISQAVQVNNQTVNTANQYIRDSIQQQIDARKTQLAKEQAEADRQIKLQQLSIQERESDQRAEQFKQTMALRQEEAGLNRQMKSRELDLLNIKARTAERMAGFQERILGEAFGAGGAMSSPENASYPNVGPMPDDGMVVPPLSQDGSAGFDLTSVVSDQDQQGNPAPPNPQDPEFSVTGVPPSLQANGVAPVPTTSPKVSSNAYEAAMDKQILGLKIAAATNPNNAGYAIQKIGELEAKRAQAAQVASMGGPSAQVANIVNQHVIPFSGLTEGPVNKDSVDKFWANAPMSTKIAVNAPEQAFDEMLTKNTITTDQGTIHIEKSDLYKARNSLVNELAAKDKGLAEAKFLATREFKEPGDQFARELVESNPYWARLQGRKEKLDAALSADLKSLGERPSREALKTLSDTSQTIIVDRAQLEQKADLLKNTWERIPATQHVDKAVNKKGEALPSGTQVEVRVGMDDWRMRKLKEPRDEDTGKLTAVGQRNADFNRRLEDYLNLKASLSTNEGKLKAGLGIMGSRGFETDVESIYHRTFGGGPPAGGVKPGIPITHEDPFRDMESKKLVMPPPNPKILPGSIFDDYERSKGK